MLIESTLGVIYNHFMATVLIVEDDRALSELYNKIFKVDGFDTIIAKDGEEAVATVKTRKLDLVLLDMHLPKMEGMEVFKKILENPDTKDIPVVFLTNVTEKSTKDEAFKLGARDYIAKAMYSPEEIVAKVKKFLPEKNS